ncbi:hypothetical protein [Streptomyces justiciae]|uniref:Secreted protein n=1 Tax=Streptomyces justiciae TaxID=2780140 RepID=A0ABU3M3G6_9ACTN|nr:hypothetical protein [Streptomyces justiciae]MDT7846032.1 hypothetical protein [Streptomyces justiciae]
MRALPTRPQRLALGIAVLTAAALGTVSASAAQSSGTTSTDIEPPSSGAAFAVAYHPTGNAPDDVNEANDDFAACMRDQGETTFPDFHATTDEEGRVRLEVKSTAGKDFDPTSKSYEKALKSCAPILKKAGITFPNPADLPKLPTPARPGEPGDELPSLHEHIEKA